MDKSDLPPSRILLVGGRNDLHVVEELRTYHSLESQFCISEKGDIDNLLASLGPEIKVSGRKVHGILVDANDAIERRWQSIGARLENEGIALPKAPTREGTIVPGPPRIGVWIMPDNQSAGELEDFVACMIPEGDPVWPLANRYIEDIPCDVRPCRAQKILRAKLYAWLATRKEPGFMGSATGRQDLDAEGQLSLSFVAWRKKLFTDIDATSQ